MRHQNSPDFLGLLQNWICQTFCFTCHYSTQAMEIVLLVLAITFIFVLWKLLQRPNHSSPPALPLIGHMHYFLSKKTLPHHVLVSLAQRYGPLIRLRFGTMPVVVASNAALAREFLRTHDQAFASRPSTLAAKLMTYNSSNLVSAPYGERWRTMKKVLISDLLSSKRLDASKKVREEEVSLLMDRFFRASQTGEPVGIKLLVTEFTFNTITRMMMNKSYYGPNAEGGDQFTSLQAEIMKLCGGLTMGDCFPYLKWLDVFTARYMKGIHRLQDEFLQKIIDEHLNLRSDGKASEEEDFVDVLLSHVDRAHLTTTNIKALLQDLIIAATDTSTVTVEWALAELLRHPEAMSKAKDELNSVVTGGQLVKETDLPQLPYLHRIVMETLRLHPPGPLLIMHKSIAACKIQGYEIPSGTWLLVNAYAIGRDPATWDSPSEFLPERFETVDKLDEYTRELQLIPFGSGRRACPGYALGLVNVQLVLANMLHLFDWSVATKEIDMREVHGLVTSLATPLKAIPSQAKIPVH